MTDTTAELEIVSIWGPTTKAMKQAVLRVRTQNQREMTSLSNDRWRRIFAVKEIDVRIEKCGETINREMVARIASYYNADADATWALIIERFAGQGPVSPEFEMTNFCRPPKNLRL